MEYSQMKTLSTEELLNDIDRMEKQLDDENLTSTSQQVADLSNYISDANRIIKNRKEKK